MNMGLSNLTILIRGGGELASGIAHRLFLAHFRVCLIEVEKPQAIRREVSFSEALYETTKTVEGVTAQFITSPTGVRQVWDSGRIPLLIDPVAAIISDLKPDILVDAIMAKRNLGTKITDARLTIGIGPGFVAGKDVHAVIESNRGHNLGKVIFQGEAEPDTGIPGKVMGFSGERVLRAPAAGLLHSQKQIGDVVKAGDVIANIDACLVKAKIDGIVRGSLRDGSKVYGGMKIGDIDPRGLREYCYTISDKARAIAGGVLEAILTVYNK
jgi:xanthine dehydrogenase accessory factor